MKSVHFIKVTSLLLALSGLRLSAQTLYIPSGTVGTSVNGYVGIGTSSPGSMLDVAGNVWIRGGATATTTAGSGSTTEMIKLISGAGTNTSGTASRVAGYTDVISGYIDFKRFASAGPGTGVVLGTYAGDALTIRSGGSGNPGYIGIGTVDPKVKLDVRGTSASSAATLQITGDSVSSLLLGQDADGGVIRSQGGSNKLKFLVGGSADQAAGGSGTEAMRIDSAGNVGVGTTTPGARLEVATNANAVNIAHGVHNKNGTQTGGNAVGIGFLNESSGTWWKAAIVHERTWDYGVGSLRFLVDDRGDNTTVGLAQTRMIITSAGNVGIGTTNPTQKLSVNGTIRAKEVIVDTGWSDYVFAPDYKLASLSEVETHIKENGHLPGIPSAKEVAEHGVSMGEMQSKLLAKIEELTLHQIEQEKRLAAQMSLLATQSRQLEQQAVRLAQLENENALLSDSHP